LGKAGSSIGCGSRHRESWHRESGHWKAWHRKCGCCGRHQFQGLGQQVRILRQGGEVILPEIQQLAREFLQPRLLFGGLAGRGGILGIRLRAAGTVSWSGHANPAFSLTIRAASRLSQCSYCIAK
jgi:hypothetical protein